ncbi:hypothetical protein F5B20DRAFT_575797 [Whalleya microplaca]|nr:hypothetical protein F5B20DRAFT_575797 [Whalleya microplaca]
MATFTALNGSDPKAPEIPSGSPITRRGASEERANSQIPNQESTVGEAASSQREHWSGPSADRPSFQSTFQPTDYAEIEGTHKRKRSGSNDLHKEAKGNRDREQHSQTESRDAYVTPQRERDYRPYSEDNREPRESWYSQQSHRDERNTYDQQHSAGSVPSQTEEQIGDELRRATTGHMESQQGYATSPDGDDGSVIYGTSYTPEQRRGDAIIQSDPKKRKRNFSNRTKTG